MSGSFRIRNNLKTLIQERGLTIADVARSAGLSYACISAMINGRSSPSPRVQLAISEVLEDPVEVLFPTDDLEDTRIKTGVA